MAELRLEAPGERRARRHRGTFYTGRRAREEPPRLKSARLLLLLAALILLSTLAWTIFARIERFASAPAVLVNPTLPLVVSHPDGGRVGAVHVAPGMEVEEGSLLLELVNPRLEAEEAQAAADAAAAALEAARLEAEISGGDFAPPAEAADLRPELAALERRLLEARRQLRESRAAAAEQEFKEAERTASALARRLEAEERALALLQEQIAAEAGSGEGEGRRLERLALERSASEARAVIEETKLAREKALARGEAARLKAAVERREREAAVLDALGEAERELGRRTAVLTSLLARRARLELRAPRAGLLQDLAVEAIGQEIAPGAPVARILPKGGELSVEARLPAEARMDVRLGQEAVVRPEGQGGATRLRARVVAVGEQPLTEAESGRSWFPVTLELLDPAESDRAQLLAGRRAEVEIRLPEESPLWFLAKPILETLHSARRE